MSDRLPADWKPPEFGDPGRTAAPSDSRGADPGPESAGPVFRMLYEIPRKTVSSREFVPLHAGYGSDAERMPTVPETEADRADTAPSDPAERERQARAAGFSKGETEGYAAGMAAAKPLVERMEGVMSDIDGLWQDLVDAYQTQIMELVCRAVEKVVMGQAAVDDDMVRRTLLEAFRTLPEPAEVTVEMHPEDAEWVETVKGDFFQTVKTLKQVDVVPNASVSKGGCRVTTRYGEIDATVESRLEAVQQSIREAHRNRSRDETPTES